MNLKRVYDNYCDKYYVKKTYTYKGHEIEYAENSICYEYFIDMNVEVSFSSLSDAKKYINGQETMWEPSYNKDNIRNMSVVKE